jgi:hypothetical protein
MPKYGLFTSSGGISGQVPQQEYEGDYIVQDKQFVKIIKSDPRKGDVQVAAIHLDRGQYVMEIKG